MDSDELKKMSAKAALEQIKDGMIIGMGSGSTVMHLINLIGQRIKNDEIDIMAVPTSYETAQLCISSGIRLTTLDEHPSLALAVDGADEVDPNLNLIKGGGAALTKEKIVGSAAKLLAILVDESKLVKTLGEIAPLPLEVLPFAKSTVLNQLKEFGIPQVRMSNRKLGPVVTDNGNFIIDIFDLRIRDYSKMEKQLNAIPGVIENGLFVNMADIVYVGSEKGVKTLTKL
ncbi:ribose-5-phosphate isomerase RpiA [Candidatus Borrarchaeum sp.]|uniref:ribose-5-phosphate isomerase RpiA n=1 Tax=Candidatus Borrarchaeum sp. TaxID=2846742 RepID=UPI00257C4A69|nr:ribose-5-phosphate isomerase RpiA [Candidatus Borrarchaeum sp.]